MRDEEQLIAYKRKYEQAKEAVSRAEGAMEHTKKRLKDEGFKSLKDAQKQLGTMERELRIKKKRLAEKMRYIEDTYDL